MQQVLLVHRGLKELKVRNQLHPHRQGRLAHKELKAHKALLAQRGRKAHKALWVRKEHKEVLARLAQLAHKVVKEPKVLKAQPRLQRERQALKERKERKAH